MPKKILITGVAGFIGMHLAKKLSAHKDIEIVGIDNFNGINGEALPNLRIKFLADSENVSIINFDLSKDISKLPKQLTSGVDTVFHLAALPGVKGGELNFHRYYRQNISMFGNILELVHEISPEKFLFASSSSVYGQIARGENLTEDKADGNNLKSFYATTKWTNEILAKQFCRLTGIVTVPLRFFTVFGIFGRPDMAYWKFTKLLLEDKSIEFWGENGGSRNFTYIEDLIQILQKLLNSPFSGYTPLNIASKNAVYTKDMCDLLATALKKPSYKYHFVKRPNFDLGNINASVEKVESLIGKITETSFSLAIREFADWYVGFKKEHYENSNW